ncbi:MAG: DUF2214 family protein [Myxococcaceae bacterium]|nr:DUF2214 family protein [Myxococcaceae bacterium]
MLGAALLSTFHLLALAVGLPGVVMRGRALRRLATDPSAVDDVLFADNLWGLAALAWIGTGLARMLGDFEKGPGFYLSSDSFLVKLGLLGVAMTLELWPMVTFIRWRVKKAKGQPLDTSKARALATVNSVEVGLTVAIPFVASMMARGIGFTWFA